MGSFKSVFAMEFRHMLRRSQTKFAMTFMLVIVVASFIESCIAFWGGDVTSSASAAFAWIGQPNIAFGMSGNLFYYFFIFFIGCMMFSDNAWLDRRNRLLSSIFSRTKKSTYIMVNAVVSFVGAFGVIFIGLILSQLLCLVTFPADSSVIFSKYATGYEVLPQNISLFSGLYLNSPYLMNIVFTFYASVWAGIMGVFSYAISLYFTKSRLILLILPTVIFMVSAITLIVNPSLTFYLFPNSVTTSEHIGMFYLMPTVFIFIIFIMLFYKLKLSKRDIVL